MLYEGTVVGMIITEFEWDHRNVGHMLSRHNVTPEEVEEAAFDGPAVWERGRTGRYYLLSRTVSGRFLFVVVAYLGRGKARAITARNMTDREKRRWRKKRGERS